MVNITVYTHLFVKPDFCSFGNLLFFQRLLRRYHFATVTPDEFAKNLREFCPELFEDEQISSLATDPLSNEEIYRKAKEDGKLEIAPKLLQKGFSIEEVATILEIDINLIAS